MNDAEIAGAAMLQASGQEIAAITVQHMLAEMERTGTLFEPGWQAKAIEPLLSAAWSIAKEACDEEAGARALYVTFLRRHADGVETIGEDMQL